MLAYQDFGCGVIERHGGHVANYLGDGILAFFGWPIAHERDADLALRAGRAMLADLVALNDELERVQGIRLAVRLGIHSGLAMVGRLGGADRNDTSVFGDAADVARAFRALLSRGRSP